MGAGLARQGARGGGDPAHQNRSPLPTRGARPGAVAKSAGLLFRVRFAANRHDAFGPGSALRDLKRDKDGKRTAIVPVPVVAKGAEGHGPGKPSVYYAIDPPLVVNFEDGSAVRFLQITMEVMAHDEKAIDSVQRNIPLIRNNLLLLMSNRNYQSMMSRSASIVRSCPCWKRSTRILAIAPAPPWPDCWGATSACISMRWNR